jgi:hypothetical protein
MKMKKITFAIEAAPAAIPLNPKIAATIAIIKKIAVHFSISVSFCNTCYNIMPNADRGYYLATLEIIKITIPIITTTINMPTQTPALKMSPMASQL